MATDLDLELEMARARRAQAQSKTTAAPTPTTAAPAAAPPQLPRAAPGSITPSPGFATAQPISSGNTNVFGATNPWGSDPLSIIHHAAVADAQAGLRGVADIAGAPVDLPLAGARLAGFGYNEALAKPLGLPEFPDIQFSLADTIAKAASWLATQAGVPPMTAKDMTPAEQSMQTPIEFGTGAALGGLGLSSRAPGLATKIAEGGKPTFVDNMVKPYLERPAAAVARDVASGVGAGAGYEFSRNEMPKIAPDNPIAQRSADIAAMLFGGLGGHGVGTAVSNVPRAADVAWSRYAPDRNVPIGSKGQTYTQAQSDLTSRVFQADASDPAKAAENIKTNAADLSAAGVPADAQPTTGMLSGDQGMVSLEQGFRARNGVPFIERDQAVKGEAASRVASLTDPAADQSAVGPGVKGAVDDIKAARDTDAIPLLMKAEASGAVVNAQPVADMIDNILSTSKRPPVVKALNEARGFLNAKNADPKAPAALDTSVSGLYEARKAINDVIEGRSDNATGRYAQKELIQVRDALDKAITDVAPEFGDYLQKFRSGSEPLDTVKGNTSAQALINGEDPRNVARGLFNGYGGAERAAEVSSMVANDPKAMAGWKAAVAEVLHDRVTGTKAIGDSYEASFARLATEFKRNEDMLAKVFTPEEMNTLRQGHKLLEFFKSAENKATVGPNTADKLLRTSSADAIVSGPLGRMTELAMKHVYGNLEGGGVMRRFRLMVGLLPTERNAAKEIAEMAFFNPELAAYLLGKPVRNISAIPSNNGLRSAIAADMANRPIEERQH